MPRYKVLKSVAHNVADSFVSALNYTRDGHVICHLLMESRSTQEEGYFMDFRSGTHSEIFDRRSLEVVAPFYTRMFWENVEKQGSSDSYVAFCETCCEI